MKAISILNEATPLAPAALASYLGRSINFLINIGYTNTDIERLFRLDLVLLNQITLLDVSTSEDDDYLLECVYEVLTVEELSNILFSGDSSLWLHTPRAVFGHATAKEMLPSAGLAGISLIRFLLEQQLDSIHR